MPKIFEYLGLLIFFYSNEHKPIHVHARKGENESRAEFLISEGIITEIRITNVKGRIPLKGSDLRDFKVFLEYYANDVVIKWIEYFIYHKNLEVEIINKRIK